MLNWMHFEKVSSCLEVQVFVLKVRRTLRFEGREIFLETVQAQGWIKPFTGDRSSRTRLVDQPGNNDAWQQGKTSRILDAKRQPIPLQMGPGAAQIKVF